MSNLRGPVLASERIATLDIVRGFALLGILIMNMQGFNTSFFASGTGTPLWTDWLNHGAEVARTMLFSGKFNSMFSLLFGIGFTIQLGRMMERAPSQAVGLYSRRLLALMAFGLVHGMVFWTGDVLHIYAVLGFGLLLLYRAPNRVIYALIAASLLYPTASGLLRMAVTTPELVAHTVAESKAWEASNNLAYGQGSFMDAAREHTREFIFFYSDPWKLWNYFGFYVQMTTTMLIGFLIGRNGWVRRIPELMPWIRKLQWWALALGASCAVVVGITDQYTKIPGPSLLKVLWSNAYVLCRLGMMSFYVLSIVRLAQLPVWQKRFSPMAAAGRMPLTNYLMQTLICTTLFYGWGFGFWGQVGPAAGLLLSVAIFVVIQIPFSVFWLRHFDYGPMEYLWRRLTYIRRPTGAPAGLPQAD